MKHPKFPFVYTASTAVSLTAIQQMREAGGVGMLLAEPGAGKSVALRTYARLANGEAGANWPVVLYRAEVVNTPRSVVAALLRDLGFPWKGRTNAGFSILRETMREDGVELILVDDAQRLTRSSLDVLRAVHEATGVPIVLAATEQMLRPLLAKRPEFANHVRDGIVMASLDERDVLRCLQAADLGRKRRGCLELIAMARVLHRSSGGNFRRMLQALDVARKAARDRHRPLTASLMAAALANFVFAAGACNAPCGL